LYFTPVDHHLQITQQII